MIHRMISWTLAVLLVAASMTAAASHQGAAQTDESVQFTRLLLTSMSKPVVYGPETGSLPAEPGIAGAIADGTMPMSFAARVDCPDDRAVSGQWADCGLSFFDQPTLFGFTATVNPSGDWAVVSGPLDQPGQNFVGEGVHTPLVEAAGEQFTVNLIVDSGTGYLGINDRFVTAFDVSQTSGPYILAVISVARETTLEYENFTISSLDDETATDSPEAQGAQESIAESHEQAEASVEDEATPAGSQTQATDTDLPNSWESSSGVVLSYDEDWEVTYEDSAPNIDSLSLRSDEVIASNTAYTLSVFGSESVESCVSERSTSMSEIWGFEIAESDEAPAGIVDIEGTTSAQALFATTQTNPDDGSIAEGLLETICIEHPESDTLFVMQFLMSSPNLDESRDLIASLTSQVDFSDASAELRDVEGPGDSANLSEGACGDLGFGSGTTFRSPTYRWSLTYGSDWFPSFSVGTEGDAISLYGCDAHVEFKSDPSIVGMSPAACVVELSRNEARRVETDTIYEVTEVTDVRLVSTSHRAPYAEVLYRSRASEVLLEAGVYDRPTDHYYGFICFGNAQGQTVVGVQTIVIIYDYDDHIPSHEAIQRLLDGFAVD